MEIPKTHRELCESLAQAKGSLFVEIPLGSRWLQQPQIADVMTVEPSYTKFSVSIYECKMTRSDLLGDLRREKWRGYLEHCNRFYFATKGGLMKKDELPPEAGLIVMGDKGWSTIKAAQNRKDVEVPYMTLLSMLFKKQTNPTFNYRNNLGRYDYSYINRAKLSKTVKYGIKLAEIFGDNLKSIDGELALAFYKNHWKDEEWRKALEYYNDNSYYIKNAKKIHDENYSLIGRVHQLEKELKNIKNGIVTANDIE